MQDNQRPIIYQYPGADQYPELDLHILENEPGSLRNSKRAKIGTYLLKAPFFGVINALTGKTLDAGENLILEEDAKTANNISNITADITKASIAASIAGILSYHFCNLENEEKEQDYHINPVNYAIANAALTLSVVTFKRITNRLGWE